MGSEGGLVGLRFARGCRCFGAWEGPALVAYGWLSGGPEWIGELGLEMSPAPQEAYVWNCVTLPDHRRRGVFRCLLQCVLVTAGAEGLTRLWIGSVEDYADKAIVDAGFRPVLRFESRAFAGWSRLRVRTADGAGPAVAAAARAALSLSAGTRVYRVRTRAH